MHPLISSKSAGCTPHGPMYAKKSLMMMEDIFHAQIQDWKAQQDIPFFGRGCGAWLKDTRSPIMLLLTKLNMCASLSPVTLVIVLVYKHWCAWVHLVAGQQDYTTLNTAPYHKNPASCEAHQGHDQTLPRLPCGHSTLWGGSIRGLDLLCELGQAWSLSLWHHGWPCHCPQQELLHGSMLSRTQAELDLRAGVKKHL